MKYYGCKFLFKKSINNSGKVIGNYYSGRIIDIRLFPLFLGDE